jgi:HD superfamily phosphohydrolases
MIKKKIINDPVHGFIDIPQGLIYEVVEHPFFQRLRNIKQLGLSYLVYPGACHSRLSHALGAMHLMREAIAVLRSKGTEIFSDEEEAACCAMLLHDLGHGPFSHALEQYVLTGVAHEDISMALVCQMNRQMKGALDQTIAIMDGSHPKRFLHQLLAGQLDVDRLDYLSRDSFYSGVAEGMIGVERIIKMMLVHNNELMVEAKGIYSVEKFLISRHLMYWQVYLHKTVVGADELLIQILRRARSLASQGQALPSVPALAFLLHHHEGTLDVNDPKVLEAFVQLDDADIDSAVKCWRFVPDKILSRLSEMLCNRHLPAVEFAAKPFGTQRVAAERLKVSRQLGISKAETDFFVQHKSVVNRGYNFDEDEIKIMYHDGSVRDIHEVSDLLSARPFSQVTKKYFLCTPKLKTGEPAALQGT